MPGVILPPSPFKKKRSFDQRLLDVAIKEIGVREAGKNRGVRVEAYQESVGLKPGSAWCAAFVHWCHARATFQGDKNPCVKTGRALGLYENAHEDLRSAVPEVGSVFVLDTGAPGGEGHCGIVEDIYPDGRIQTVEGNTNAAGSREGNCVARHTWNPTEGTRGKLIGYVAFGRGAR